MFNPAPIAATATRIVRHNARRLLVVAAAVALTMAVSGTMSNASSGRTVKTQGNEGFVPNAKIMATLKFAPGHLVVSSGETLTLDHADQTEDPHTLSIVNDDELPADIEAVLECGAPGTVCDDVFSLFPGGPSSSQFVEGPGTGSGIDGRLDTLLVLPGDSISAEVTAPPGTTLHFMCAIHAWMQGTIDVK